MSINYWGQPTIDDLKKISPVYNQIQAISSRLALAHSEERTKRVSQGKLNRFKADLEDTLSGAFPGASSNDYEFQISWDGPGNLVITPPEWFRQAWHMAIEVGIPITESLPMVNKILAKRFGRIS